MFWRGEIYYSLQNKNEHHEHFCLEWLSWVTGDISNFVLHLTIPIRLLTYWVTLKSTASLDFILLVQNWRTRSRQPEPYWTVLLLPLGNNIDPFMNSLCVRYAVADRAEQVPTLNAHSLLSTTTRQYNNILLTSSWSKQDYRAKQLLLPVPVGSPFFRSISCSVQGI